VNGSASASAKAGSAAADATLNPASALPTEYSNKRWKPDRSSAAGAAESLGADPAPGRDVELHVEGTPVELPPGVDLSAFRIVQEALTNTLKHAGQARAEVTVRYRLSSVELEVVDDGPGANGVGRAGHGLIGMRERAALYGGVLEAGNRNGRGYVVRAQLPIHPDAAR
jgi:signal transduction histidine kinase